MVPELPHQLFLILVNKNIITVDIQLFERACRFNKDVVKWIYTVKKDIDINNNIAFLNACSKDKIDIIEFFIVFEVIFFFF